MIIDAKTSNDFNYKCIGGDIYRHIFSFLPLQSLSLIAQVCRLFRSKVNDHLINQFLNAPAKHEIKFLRKKVKNWENADLIDFLTQKSSQHAIVKLILLVKLSSDRKIFFVEKKISYENFSITEKYRIANCFLNELKQIRQKTVDLFTSIKKEKLFQLEKCYSAFNHYLEEKEDKIFKIFKLECCKTFQFDLQKDLNNEKTYPIECFTHDLRYDNEPLMPSLIENENPIALFLDAIVQNDENPYKNKLLKSAQKGLAISQYYYWETREWDDESSMRWLRQAADQGFPAALLQMANYANNGQSKFEYTYKAAIGGSIIAQGKLGLMLGYGKGTSQNVQEGIKYLRKAACLASKFYAKQFAYDLSCLYFDNAISDREGIYWLTKAANQKYSSALYDLGLMYAYGYHVKKDKLKAAELFCQAGKLQDNSSHVLLIAMGVDSIDQQNTINKSYINPLNFCGISEEEACNDIELNRLYLKYQFIEGLMYQHGIRENGKTNPAKAFKIFNKIANKSRIAELHLKEWKNNVERKMKDFAYQQEINHEKTLMVVLDILAMGYLFKINHHEENGLILVKIFEYAERLDSMQPFEKFQVLKKINEFMSHAEHLIPSMTITFDAKEGTDSNLVLPWYYKYMLLAVSPYMRKKMEEENSTANALHLSLVEKSNFYQLVKFIEGEQQDPLSDDKMNQIIELANRLDIQTILMPKELDDPSYDLKSHPKIVRSIKLYQGAIVKKNKVEEINKKIREYYSNYRNTTHHRHLDEINQMVRQRREAKNNHI